jgi:hypothetical protein
LRIRSRILHVNRRKGHADECRRKEGHRKEKRTGANEREKDSGQEKWENKNVIIKNETIKRKK